MNKYYVVNINKVNKPINCDLAVYLLGVLQF